MQQEGPPAQGPLPTPATKWRLPHSPNCPRAEHKPSGEGKGMLQGLQEAVGSRRQGCSPPPPLRRGSKGLSTNGEGLCGAHTQLLLDVFHLTPLPAFHLGLRQRCTASCLLPIAEQGAPQGSVCQTLRRFIQQLVSGGPAFKQVTATAGSHCLYWGWT